MTRYYHGILPWYSGPYMAVCHVTPDHSQALQFWDLGLAVLVGWFPRVTYPNHNSALLLTTGLAPAKGPTVIDNARLEASPSI
jgi:hypothetical protein